MARNRPANLFIEINRPGPPTDKSIPISERVYYPYRDMEDHANIARVTKLLMVDLPSMTLVDGGRMIPSGQLGVFSLLAPENSPPDLVFPGLIWPETFGPMDFPLVSALTIGQRFHELQQIRRSLVTFTNRIRQMLLPWQIAELESPTIDLFVLKNQCLISHQVDRRTFFRILHPTYNPLFTTQEATFLRGACYALRGFQQECVATSLDRLLRLPQLDEYMCRTLLEMGCLDREGLDSAATGFLERYEDMAAENGQDSESSSSSCD